MIITALGSGIRIRYSLAVVDDGYKMKKITYTHFFALNIRSRQSTIKD
jgi:hypothetical protein